MEMQNKCIKRLLKICTESRNDEETPETEIEG